MGIARGPNTVKDGLVFGCDTGYGIADNSTATRFYPGKPTSNALETEANWIYLGTNITNPADYPVALPAEVNFQKGASQGSINWADACRNYTDSYSAGTKITVSGWHMFYSTDISLTMNSRDRLGWHYSKDGASTYGGTIYTATQWNKWYYFSSTFSSTGVTTSLRVEDGGADYYRSSEDAAKTTQYYCNLQIEVGTDIVSPYVKGTRSSTASLIDLKRTANIDVSNVSFDSTGQPTFDGTNDYILTPFTRGTLGDELTMIAYYKYTGGSTRTYTPIFGGLESGAGTEFFIGKNSGNTHIGVQDGNYTGAFVQGSNAWDGNYHQIVYTYENGTGKIYLDGVLKNSGSFTKCNSAEQITVGRESEGSGYWFLGDIPRAYVYDKVLSAAEVLQDFNANKNRFDI